MSAAINIPIPERETYVPSFTPKFTDESLPVRGRKGEPLGFTIADVLPERRFALASNGQCLSERDFEPLYFAWVAKVCIPDGRVIALASVNRYFDPKLEPVPNPEEFVNARIVNGKILPITFDETKVEMVRGDADRRYDANGEIVSAEKARASLADRTALSKVEVLKDLLADGTISEAQFAEKVSALVSGTASPAEVVAATEKPPGFDAVLAPDEPEEAKAGGQTAPCGKVMKAGIAMHIKHCKTPECTEARTKE